MRRKWFRKKSNGLVWPCAWQGWVLFIMYLLLVIKFAMELGGKSLMQFLTIFIPELLLLTIGLFLMCYMTMERTEESKK